MARIVVVLMVAVSCGVFDTPQRTGLDELIQNVPFGETVQMALSPDPVMFHFSADLTITPLAHRS
jgi:hypothetical protein